MKHIETILFHGELRFQQEALGFFQEQIQAIVMHPMPGAGDLHQAMIPDGRGAVVGIRIGEGRQDFQATQAGAAVGGF